MIRAGLPRLLRSLGVLIVIAALTCQLAFLMPGDPALILLGPESSEAQRAELRRTLGLDQSFPVRFFDWMRGILTGDWGTSFTSGRPVLTEIIERLPVTFELVLLSQILALAIIIPLALASARRVNGTFDRVVSGATFITLAIPSFVVGVLLIYLFAVNLGWLPATGFVPFGESPLENLRRMILPALTLGIAEAAVYTRALRGSAIEAVRSPYAYATLVRGASDRDLLWRRILRPASPTLVAMLGITIATALGGSLLVEQLFALPGLGRLTVGALGSRDLPLIQGVVFFSAIIVVIAGILTDISLTLIDRRTARVRP
ncbi:ABC transporter permease [Mycetocola spongiae]|uniref:ABC transporter permease n=1 Tax=Mycetocola spongiae TaxID=2859226 RepID=UPI001CF41E02|nr:ABC transporter permease [Mycetocola spongiae]UCR89461.1 ABC transporter permease [Mycetocola spongiae]